LTEKTQKTLEERVAELEKVVDIMKEAIFMRIEADDAANTKLRVDLRCDPFKNAKVPPPQNQNTSQEASQPTADPQPPQTSANTKDFDVELIEWVGKENENGKFDLAREVENKGNPNYINLKAYLAPKPKKSDFLDGMFYWIMRGEGDALGRKKTQGRR